MSENAAAFTCDFMPNDPLPSERLSSKPSM
jgi:hypothetical protein